jgi:gliding motility-associated-like protein
MAGEYVVGIVDSNGCFNSYITQVNQAHEIYTHIYPSNALCHDDSSAVALLEIIGGTEPYTVTWSNGDETRNLIDVPAGNYEVVIVDANGCMAYDTVYLTQPNPIIVDSIIVHPSCTQLEDGKIFVSASGGTGEYSYLWSTDAVEDSIVNLQAGFYYLTVTDEHGCETVKAYKLNKPEEDCLTIWTSFSPDGDGVNDVWNIGNIDLYPDCKVEIFNRWGNKIFESKGYYEPWDGTWNGKPLPEETYYYAITLGDGRRPFTGTVTIIR